MIKLRAICFANRKRQRMKEMKSLLLVNAGQITARASGSELNHSKCILWMQYLCQKLGTLATFFACAVHVGDYVQCVVDLR